MKETIETLIRQAESTNAGEISLTWDYNDTWDVKFVVKRKRKKTNTKHRPEA